MSMFTEKKESEKALNVKGAEVMKTIINWKELSIKHEIRRLRADGMTQQAIADMFEVNREAIGKIVRRERWTHV